MTVRRVRLTFPRDLVTRPVIYHIGVDFGVVTNIRRAEVGPTGGHVMLELDGDGAKIDMALAWVQGEGVRVDPLTGDVVEG